ncbi:MAG TPA: hypothetical protein VM533_01030 [Fimbriiglobus sp.]|nr:hypothetical protein [Fimbriiglobus sp.]
MAMSFALAVRGLLLYGAVQIGPAISEPPAPGDSEYMFVQDTKHTVSILRGGYMLVGKLDGRGNFTEGYRYHASEPRSSGSGGPARNRFASIRPEKAYEYHSGILIPGEMYPDGTFLPQVGGTIIKFADYKMTAKSPPIWNLPGWFVPRKHPAGDKK